MLHESKVAKRYDQRACDYDKAREKAAGKEPGNECDGRQCRQLTDWHENDLLPVCKGRRRNEHQQRTKYGNS